jgi:hypothetical protein
MKTILALLNAYPNATVTFSKDKNGDVYMVVKEGRVVAQRINVTRLSCEEIRESIKPELVLQQPLESLIDERRSQGAESG